MKLSGLDIGIIISYLVIALCIGLYFAKRAGRNLTDFFLSGRALPWWVAGTSLAAAGFASDTPLLTTELVRRSGSIGGNWFLWCFALSNLCATFLFFRFWRRAKILTELEIIEERYEGRSAAFLRGFQSVFYGIAFASLNIGFIMLAMQSIISELLGWNAVLALSVLLGITIVYATASGLWGVVATEVFQFCVAFVGSIMLTVYSIKAVGGLKAIQPKLAAVFGSRTAEGIMSFVPSASIQHQPVEHLQHLPVDSSTEMTWTLFFVYILALWWISERADGNGMFIQRIMATKNEFQAFLAGLWFNVVYYAILMWPWIIVALISLIMFPELTDHKLAYPRMIGTFLPSGAKGLMVAAFLASFMSSVTGLINWGSSYMMNDCYKRFIHPNASQRHYIWMGRIAMVFVMFMGIVVWCFVDSLAGAWKFVAELWAGLGSVWLARWFWWRVNAWSEITAYSLSIIGCITINLLEHFGIIFPESRRYLMIAIFSTSCWVTVTMLTAPVSDEKLCKFVRKVNPGGILWRRITKLVDPKDMPSHPALSHSFLPFLLGAFSLYLIVFGLGQILFKSALLGLGMIAVAVVLVTFIFRIEKFAAEPGPSQETEKSTA